MNKVRPKITAAELDRRFDDGEDIDEFVDWDSAQIVHPDGCRVAVEIPANLVEPLDDEAKRLNLSRSELIERWITGHLKTVGE